jgi:uncharacterized phiE125 gp8 family phage protein
MPYVLVSAPTAEPVTLAEAKLHLRVDDNADDALIGALITAARQHAEHDTRRALVTQTWKLALDVFPENVVTLDHAPVSTVVSVVYTDPDGVNKTLDAGAYQLDAITEPCRLVPAYGNSWPATRAQVNAVAVTYTCGYGEPESVPVKAQIFKNGISVRAPIPTQTETSIGVSLKMVKGMDWARSES